MIIGIDGSEAMSENRVGVSEYAYNILHSLYRISEKEKGKNSFVVYLKDFKKGILPPEREDFIYKFVPGKSFWIFKYLLPELYKKQKPDVLFSPTHYLPILTPIPQVCTIHDLGYLMFSEQFRKYDFWQLKYWTAISLYISKYIISVSETTRKDIVRHYPRCSKKIRVIHHGVNHDLYKLKYSDNLVRRVKNKYKIRNNYILSLGTLKPSKNIEGIIKSFSVFLNNNKGLRDDYQLVIAGKKGWLFKKIFESVKKENIESNVVFTDYISDSDKVALYHGARFLIAPSYWEGFGINILEAMACGTPVLVSDNGALSEVAGSSGIYADPYDISDIVNKITKLVMLDKIEYNSLKNKCHLRSLSFDWDKTAEKTLRLFEKFNC